MLYESPGGAASAFTDSIGGLGALVAECAYTGCLCVGCGFGPFITGWFSQRHRAAAQLRGIQIRKEVEAEMLAAIADWVVIGMLVIGALLAIEWVIYR